jgi:hypothetical protein
VLGFVHSLILTQHKVSDGHLCQSSDNSKTRIQLLKLDAGKLAKSQYPEGPVTGHLDTGFS